MYEIISEKKAFAGKSAASVIAAIIEREPAPLAIEPPLDRVIRRCLAKDPDNRFQTARDLKQPHPGEGVRTGDEGAASPLGGHRRCLPAMFDVNAPEGTRFGVIISVGGSAISPDGRTLAFVATNAKGESLLNLRPVDSL